MANIEKIDWLDTQDVTVKDSSGSSHTESIQPYWSTGRAINASNVVAGSYGVILPDFSGWQHAFTWDDGAVAVHDLNGVSACAMAINDAGWIGGQTVDSAGHAVGFLCSVAHTMTAADYVPAFPGGYMSGVLGLSSMTGGLTAPIMAGTASPGMGTADHAFKAASQAVLEDLSPAGAGWSVAQSVHWTKAVDASGAAMKDANNKDIYDHTTVGFFYDFNLGFRAFRCCASTTPEMIEIADGRALGMTFVTDASGQTTAWVVGTTPGFSGRAAMWAMNGNQTLLGEPAAWTGSIAQGGNAKGQVVGWATQPWANDTHACLWTGVDMTPTVTDLNEMKVQNQSQYTPSQLGWTLTKAYAINDAGYVVGEGIKDGRTRAFRLRIVP